MATRALVQARIDLEVKEAAATVLEALGLTVSDAVRLLLTKVANEKELPFQLYTPGPKTRAAIDEARKGGLPRASTVEELMAALNAED